MSRTPEPEPKPTPALDPAVSTDSPDWRAIHALGLPPGSIRALLAILIFASTWVLLVFKPGREVPDVLRDLLFIIMGHYFASRRAVPPPDEAGPPPLYLPRGSVRLILVAGTALVAWLLYRRGQLNQVEQNPGAYTLILVGAFLLGVVVNAAIHWWKAKGHRSPRIVEDLRALVSLAAGLLLIALVLNGSFEAIPRARLDAWIGGGGRMGPYGPEHLLSALVGFYFGSRS